MQVLYNTHHDKDYYERCISLQYDTAGTNTEPVLPNICVKNTPRSEQTCGGVTRANTGLRSTMHPHINGAARMCGGTYEFSEATGVFGMYIDVPFLCWQRCVKAGS